MALGSMGMGMGMGMDRKCDKYKKYNKYQMHVLGVAMCQILPCPEKAIISGVGGVGRAGRLEGGALLRHHTVQDHTVSQHWECQDASMRQANR